MSDGQRLPLEYTLLGFLMHEPAHGYDLHRQVEDELGFVWRMGQSNVYAALKRLEQSGQVEASLVPQENRPPRNVYRITAAGRDAFLAWLRQATRSMHDMRVTFPARLYFLHVLGLDGAEELIAAQEEVCRAHIERQAQAVARRPGRFNRMVFDFRRRQLEAVIEWLQACRDEWAWNESESANR